MLKNLSIRLKLLVSFFVVTLCTLVVGWYGVYNVSNNDALFAEALAVNERTTALLEIKNAIRDIGLEVSAPVQVRSEKTKSENMIDNEASVRLLAALERIEVWKSAYENHLTPKSEIAADVGRRIASEHKEVSQLVFAYIVAAGDKGSVKEATSIAHNIQSRLEHVEHLMQIAITASEEEVIHVEGLIRQQFDLVKKVNGGMSLATIVIALACTFLMARTIDKPIRKLRDAAIEMAEGGFSTRVPFTGRDEIGELAQAVNNMMGSLEKTQTNLKSKAEEMEEKAREMEAQITEKERTKKAILNILEDTQEAEKREADQALELKEALGKVNEFASVADRERNMSLLLLASIGEGVLVLDMERKVTVLNRVAERTIGYKTSEIIGKKFDECIRFIYSNKEPLEETFWNEAFSSKFSMAPANNLSIVGKDGVSVPIFMVLAPIVDSNNQESKGVIITFRDVREERALEEARIGFISTASHQLRTPLTSMRWFSEMLLGGDAGNITEEQKHFVERIYQGTDRMIALVNLLLQLARVEAGRVKVEPVPIDFKTITEGVLMTTKVNFDAKKQRVAIRTEPDPLPVVPMDQDMIWQVIQNLLSNASRYSPVESVINVAIVQKEDMIEYSVADTGIGIPKDQAPRLFEKFFRAENAIAAVPEGSGLGLSLVKNLVEGWGGRIWFESEEGKGTTFYFTVPLAGMKPKEGEVKLAV